MTKNHPTPLSNSAVFPSNSNLSSPVDLLILGAGWTSTFLIPLLSSSGLTYAATTTTGRNNTITFKFDPESTDTAPYKRLPPANTVLITFPLVGPGQSKRLTDLYRAVHGKENRWIQLGSTGIFNKCESWNTDESPYDVEDRRAVAEDELRDCVGGVVLCLAGLWGGSREPRMWLPRIAKSKEDVRKKKAVHFVHGEDVARAIVATMRRWEGGKRWIVADLRVYDWWDLILSFSALEGENEEVVEEQREMRRRFAEWVGELMVEEGLRALPRSEETLGRKLDSRGFWKFVGVWPMHKRLA